MTFKIPCKVVHSKQVFKLNISLLCFIIKLDCVHPEDVKPKTGHNEGSK